MKIHLVVTAATLSAAMLITGSAHAAGLNYDDPVGASPPQDRQPEQPRAKGPTSGETVTDAAGRRVISTWSSWASDVHRQPSRQSFSGGQDTTRSPSSMLSGRLEWGHTQWSDCQASTNNAYCGTTISGAKERDVWCGLDRINGSTASVEDGHCLGLLGAKPQSWLSCTTTVVSNCVQPPVVVTVNRAPGGSFLANNMERPTFTAVVRRTTGEVAANETVHWTTSLGTLNTTTTTTNNRGETAVNLRSGSVGWANVTARSHESSKSAGVEFVSPVPNLIAFWPSRANGLNPDNSDYSVLTAILQYDNGRRAEGHNIHFTNNFGWLDQQNVSTNWNGEARTNIRSGSPGTATIWANGPRNTVSTQVSFRQESETHYDKQDTHVFYVHEWYDNSNFSRGLELEILWKGNTIYENISTRSREEIESVYFRGYIDVGGYRYSWDWDNPVDTSLLYYGDHPRPLVDRLVWGRLTRTPL